MRIWHFYRLSPPRYSHRFARQRGDQIDPRAGSVVESSLSSLYGDAKVVREATRSILELGSPFATWARDVKMNINISECWKLDWKHRISVADSPSVEPANKWKDISGAYITGYRALVGRGRNLLHQIGYKIRHKSRSIYSRIGGADGTRTLRDVTRGVPASPPLPFSLFLPPFL